MNALVSAIAGEAPVLAVVDGGTFRQTDYGNAEHLIALHGRDLMFVPGPGWYVWDGRRWARDDSGEVLRRAKATVRQKYAAASNIDDEKERKAAVAWAMKSEAVLRLRAAVQLAESELKVIARPVDLDSDPFALNVANGTVDLRSGRLREHRRKDRLTKLAPVDYRRDATSDVWTRFLHDVTGGDAELAAFLQRAVGYTLTGDTGEEVLLFLHGSAATGKTTMLEAIKRTLGDYSASADFETFLAKPATGGPRPDIARLAGARLVIGVEVDDGKRLAEGLVKQLTGGDTITARYLNQNPFEFRPAFKLWLAANHRPKVSASDEAIWRRIIQIPFTNVVPIEKRDPALKRTLTTDPNVRSAILAWAVQGCLAWQKEGLAVPESVHRYTAEYRAENDSLAGWLEDCCTLAADAVTATGELRESYERWAQHNGEKPVGPKVFAAGLKSQGCEQKRTGQARMWRGIALGQAPQPPKPPPPDDDLSDLCVTHGRSRDGQGNCVWCGKP